MVENTGGVLGRRSSRPSSQSIEADDNELSAAPPSSEATPLPEPPPPEPPPPEPPPPGPSPPDPSPSPDPHAAPYRDTAAPVPRRATRYAPYRPRELASALFLVAALDVALWSQSAGSVWVGGYALAMAGLAFLVGLFLASRHRTSPRLWVISSLIGVLCVRLMILPALSATLLLLALLAALPLALRARRTAVPEVVTTLMQSMVALPLRALSLWGAGQQLGERARLDRSRVLPVLIPLGVSAAFLGVFGLANPVVADGIAQVFEWLSAMAFPAPGRIMLWGVVASMALLAIRPAVAFAGHDEEASTEESATEIQRLVGRNTLVAVNVLFLAYLALDATYLLRGEPPAGTTTQHYAHQGALWLTVALVMLTFVVGLLFRGALSHDPHARNVRLLAYVWGGQGLLLALGTYQRIGIHVAHSGLSDLRIVGILGTTLVVAGMLLTLQKMRAGRSLTWLLRRQLDALVVACALYAVLPTHWIGAQVNVARIEAGELGPVLHLGPQSRQIESVAALVPLLHHPDATVREGVAALILSSEEGFRRELARRRTWREQDLASGPVASLLAGAVPAAEEALGETDRQQAIRALASLGELAARGEPTDPAARGASDDLID